MGQLTDNTENMSLYGIFQALDTHGLKYLFFQN